MKYESLEGVMMGFLIKVVRIKDCRIVRVLNCWYIVFFLISLNECILDLNM